MEHAWRKFFVLGDYGAGVHGLRSGMLCFGTGGWDVPGFRDSASGKPRPSHLVRIVVSPGCVSASRQCAGAWNGKGQSPKRRRRQPGAKNPKHAA